MFAKRFDRPVLLVGTWSAFDLLLFRQIDEQHVLFGVLRTRRVTLHNIAVTNLLLCLALQILQTAIPVSNFVCLHYSKGADILGR